jgi:hypothetical protein
LQVYLNFNTNIYRQQAPFSGAVVGEQVVKIQSSIAFVNIFSFSFDFSFASLNFDHDRHRWHEECIQVNLDSRYVKWSILNMFYLIMASDGRSQRRMNPRNKRCCIRQDHESKPACEDQKDDQAEE